MPDNNENNLTKVKMEDDALMHLMLFYSQKHYFYINFLNVQDTWERLSPLFLTDLTALQCQDKKGELKTQVKKQESEVRSLFFTVRVRPCHSSEAKYQKQMLSVIFRLCISNFVAAVWGRPFAV